MVTKLEHPSKEFSFFFPWKIKTSIEGMGIESENVESTGNERLEKMSYKKFKTLERKWSEGSAMNLRGKPRKSITIINYSKTHEGLL